MNKLRKFLAASTLVTTVFGMTVVVNPASAAASNGDLIKMNGVSSVYYLKDGKRFVFPNESTYFSWYSDWNGVKVVPQDELYGYPLGGNVTLRAGTKLVKITTNPTVYAVEPNGTLRSIVSEANAIELWGSNWAKNVVDVADAFFTNYTVGQPLTAGVYPAGSVLRQSGSSDLYFYDGTNYRKFANDSAFLANGFNFSYVVTTNKTITASGTAITGAETALMNVAQGSTTGQGGNVYTGGSAVSVALASDTAASVNVPKNASLVPFGKFNLTAGNDGDITIKGLTLTRTGLGKLDSSEIYLFDGDTRLTSFKTINTSSNTATFSLNFVIPKGTTKAITAMVNIKGTDAKDNNALTIAKAADVVAAGNATVSGSFPISGNTMNINGTEAGTVLATMKAVANTTLKVGETQQEVAKFELKAGSAEDITVSRITLINNGSTNFDDLKNFKLYRSSDLVATTEVAESTNKVVLKLTTPLKIEKSGTKMFSLKADIVAGAADTVKFDVDEAIDVVATGVTYGFTVAPSYVNLPAISSNFININAGELNFSINSPAAYNITDDADNVNLANIDVNVKGNNPITVKTMYGKITATSPKSGVTNLSQAIENVQLVNVTNNQYFDVSVVDTPTATEYIFKVTNFDMPAGKSTWRVELDTVKDNVQANEKFTFSMLANTVSSSAGIDAKNSDNKTITDIVTGGEISGNPVTIKTASITMNTKPLATGQAVVNAKGVKLLEMTAKAGDSTNVKLTEVVATLAGKKNDASNYTLYVDGVAEPLKAGVSASADNGSVTFSGLNNGGLTINKGETKTLYITADIAPTVTGTNLALSIAAPAGITAEDVDTANTVTPNTATISGRTVTLVSAGTLAFALDSSNDSKNHIVLSGSTDNEVIKIKADATNEDVKVKTLRFALPDTTVKRGVAKAALYQNGTKVIDTTTFVTIGGVDYIEFTNLDTLSTPVVVKADVDSIFTVKLDIANVGTGANDTAVSGDVLSLAFNGASTTSTEAVGNASNKDASTSGTANSKNYTTYATKVTAVKSSSQPTTLSAGIQEALKFTLTSDSKNGKTAQLKGVTTTISKSGAVTLATGTNAYIYSGSTLLGAASCTAGTACEIKIGDTDGDGDLETTFDDISSSEVYTLKVDTTGADADDKITTRIVVNNGTDGIVWNDNKDNQPGASIASIDLGEKSDITVIENQILY